jgi:RecA/RadA recombinase
MATRKPTADAPQFDIRSFYRQTLDDITKKQGLSSDPLEDITPMSAGWLMLDLMFGGGIRPAMYTFAGEEQTAKTTLALSTMAQAIKVGVPLIAFWDYEGSTVNSRPYIANILKTMGVTQSVDQIFGKIDKHTGEILIDPMITYFATGVGEHFFNWVAAIERAFPDKRFVGGKWWLIYDDSKENRAKVGQFHVPEMAKRHGKGLWIPAPDGNLQGLIIVDAWSAMNPGSNDEDEADNSLGVMARFFAKHMPRIKARLAPKMIALIGMNHLSDIPMAMYGPKQREKGGNDLRAKSDARIWNHKRTSGMPFNPVFDKDEGFEIEKSVESEGSDRYIYVQSKNIKNKLSQPKRKVWFRVWSEDASGDARGFDPFFDTMCYLSETGQLIGNTRKKLKLKLDGVEVPNEITNWFELKSWVLGDKATKIEVCKRLGVAKPFDLRSFCFKQMASGKGEALYIAHKNGKVKDEESDDE